ncbi:hypothetical protein llap_16015 [Limosa lapponica baueri]|uniref:Uncharacterized protein n=1 Tax=Limosa lapponica baueri TaxID=1758121 RepID=A0A2I0TIU3_LIMLA|nr:hypothetical protein llap_16015 [Limosa lapponica baueri]
MEQRGQDAVAEQSLSVCSQVLPKFMRWPTPCKSPKMSWRNSRRPLPKLAWYSPKHCCGTSLSRVSLLL